MMRFGVGIARRAWLGKADILNCLDADELGAAPRPAKRDVVVRTRRGDPNVILS